MEDLFGFIIADAASKRKVFRKISGKILPELHMFFLFPGDTVYAKTDREREHKMIEQDTIKLLRECDAGIKMGVDSIEDVLDYTRDEKLKQTLNDCKREHDKLKTEVQEALDRFHDDGKDPNPIAQGMSFMKTNMKLVMHESDSTIAELITDGCNMGVKSLNRYLNQYEAADESSKDIAKRLIHLEECLATDMRGYL